MLYSSVMISSVSLLRIDISNWIYHILLVFFTIKLYKINLFRIYDFIVKCTLINYLILVFNNHLSWTRHVIWIVILNRWLSF